MEHIILCVFLLLSILTGQDTDTSITISHFIHPDKRDIPIILDEGGENSFFLDTHYPGILNDSRINHIRVDGALHLPQGSYLLPALLPKGTAPDSIHNYSQIHYKKGDYDSGELGLALQIQGIDSSYFILQGFRQSPPVIYSSVSVRDNLQNYLMSYERFSTDESMAVDVMYHLEDYHLPLTGGLTYYRKTESFHGSASLRKHWGIFSTSLNPAYQFTKANRDGESATYLTLWDTSHSSLQLFKGITATFQYEYKMIMSATNEKLNEYATHIIRPKLKYEWRNVGIEGGATFFKKGFEPEGLITWKKGSLCLSVSRVFQNFHEPINLVEFIINNMSITSLNIGYISRMINVTLDIYQVDSEGATYPGLISNTDIDISWLRLFHRAGVYNLGNMNQQQPLDMFHHMALIISPNIWSWRTARYQPFIGVKSIYLQHSGNAGIDPTRIPIYINQDLEAFTSHLINMELGFLVNRFKVSYSWFNLLDEPVKNSNTTKRILPVRQLVVVWQFWN